MEIRAAVHIKKMVAYWLFCTACCLAPGYASAQPLTAYSIKDGKMYIMLDRGIKDFELQGFMEKYDLGGIGLWQLVKTRKHDSLEKEGWKVEEMNEVAYVISKFLEGADRLEDPANKILLTQKETDFSSRFPIESPRWRFGYNRFKNKYPFAEVRDSVVEFYLRGYSNAQRVYLAGSFNNWSPTLLPMKNTDSGWIAFVKMAPGKYWYKFVVDGDWELDTDNELRENDGMGNMNSVFYKTNRLFTLTGFTNAKNVFLSGSFNNWKTKELRMNRTADGWALPLYLANGTHMYKFIVDGKWIPDEKNSDKSPDGSGGFNSVLSIGNPYVFRLDGFDNAKQVLLVGSFNNWREFELLMKKTATGWELPFVLGPGNYEYKFLVDGKWITDPGNPMTPTKDGNSFLIIEPNYVFRLKGFENAKTVYLAGDFNSWNPEAYPMKREGNDWTFGLYLPAGKTRYKFIVDGKWILDPANKLWEQNEHRTGNSILWIDNKAP